MTKEEKLAVFKAYLDGKPIECREKTSHDYNWRPVSMPSWAFHTFDYRVKPEEIPADKVAIDWKASYEALSVGNKNLTEKIRWLEAVYRELGNEKKHLFDQNKKLQSAYDEMKEHRDALQANLAAALARIEAQRANFVTLNDNYSAAIEQRDEAEQEADSLRGVLNALHDSLHNAILS